MKSRASCGSKGSPQADDLRALTAGHFADAIAEESVGEEGEFAAGFSEIGDSGLHPGTARTRRRQIEGVGRGVGVPQQAADLFVYLEEKGIEMSDDGLRHCLVNTGRHYARTGAEKQAARRLKRRVGCGHKP